MKVEIKIPAIGESVNSAIIGAWQKASGDYVQVDEVIVLLETDKASVEIPSQGTGKLEILKQNGEEAQIGETIGVIDTSFKQEALKTLSSQKQDTKKEEASKEETQKEPDPKISAQKKSSSSDQELKKDSPPSLDPSQFSPSVRHVLMEKKIHHPPAQGSGREGRLTKKDLLSKEVSQSLASSPFLEGQKPFEEGSIRREKMTTIRKRIAERLVASQHNTATLTTFNEVDMTRILELRKNYKEVFQKKYQIKLGFMGFFIKAVIQALKAYPRVGAQIEGDEIVFHKHAHISIAVSTERGLIVPVIRYADQMSVAEIEKAVIHFAKKARDGQIRPDDLSGGLFTISNGGVFGSLLSTPILNPPQSGILGMHKIEKRPVVAEGQIVIRPMMYLALSYDHRIVDGRESVGFLVTVKECIEEPTRLLLDI